MNNRDQLDMFWPSASRRRTTPSGRRSRCTARCRASNFGWPYCYYDYGTKKLVLNPEYGGDGKTVGRCAKFTAPVAAFPAHWAPVDVKFYTGTQFPAKYRNGAFIAFHGSWNRSPSRRTATTSRSSRSPAASRRAKFEMFAEALPARSR